MKARIAHLSTVHLWDDVRIFHKECASLSEAGYDVSLITGCVPERIDSKVRLVAVGRRDRKLPRMIYGFFRALRAALREKADLYHFHDPELIPVGLLLKLLGKRVVYDVHEDVPEDILIKDWIPRRLRRIVSRLAGMTQAVGARCFDGIVAATPHIARRFPQHKTATVRNFPVLGKAVAADVRPFAERSPIVAYVGLLSRIRGICQLVDAMPLVPPSLEARLCLAGAFRPAALEKELQGNAGWRHTDFLGWCRWEHVARVLAEARIGVLTLWPTRTFVDSLPTKLFEYMAAGLPVVASDFPLWREIIAGTGCGLLVDPCDPSAIAQAIQWLLEHPAQAAEMGRRGQTAVAERFNWEQESRILLNCYRDWLGEGDGSGSNGDRARKTKVRKHCDAAAAW